jgi:dolichol-phosphate mannosyltransferase
MPKTLIAIPVYNEQQYVDPVLEAVRRHAQGSDILVVDDGSTDQTPQHLASQPVDVIRHAENRGYGRSLKDAFRWAECYGYDWLITMDCDEQHEPAALGAFFEAIEQNAGDIISGSRYHPESEAEQTPPSERRTVNQTVTRWINECLGLRLTDAFCGYKAYRVAGLKKLKLDVNGYASPLQVWVQAAAHELRVTELPVRLIYKDPARSFGGALDDREQRLAHYRETFEHELAKYPEKFASPCTCEK